MVAQDSGSPPRSATALARIEVTRNLFSPRWDSLDYSDTVLETLAVGASVLQVRAFDDDTRVSARLSSLHTCLLCTVDTLFMDTLYCDCLGSTRSIFHLCLHAF